MIETEDHDPLYGMLGRAIRAGEIDDATLKRWLLAYWMFYHPGVASYLAEKPGEAFWDWVYIAAVNKESPRDVDGIDSDRWPRAHERRHFRGDKCVDAVRRIERQFPEDPEEVVVRMTRLDQDGPVKLKDIETSVCAFPQFGPWIAFKIADMAERVLDRPVEFSKKLVSFYREPRKGAEMAAPFLRVGPDAVPGALCYFLRDIPASGLTPRFVNIQEVETVLCKWKSAMGGHYFIGADIVAYHKGMPPWGKLAKRLANHLPPIPN